MRDILNLLLEIDDHHKKLLKNMLQNKINELTRYMKNHFFEISDKIGILVNLKIKLLPNWPEYVLEKSEQFDMIFNNVLPINLTITLEQTPAISEINDIETVLKYLKKLFVVGDVKITKVKVLNSHEFRTPSGGFYSYDLLLQSSSPLY